MTRRLDERAEAWDIVQAAQIQAATDALETAREAERKRCVSVVDERMVRHRKAITGDYPPAMRNEARICANEASAIRHDLAAIGDTEEKTDG